jgi:uncharacterized membrane protein
MAARTAARSTRKTPARPRKSKIVVREIGVSDLNRSLGDGWRDFMDMRGDIIFLMILYPLIGIVAAIAALGGALLPLFLPIAAGIGLLGPVVAVGFYEMARRREMGLHSNWKHFLDVTKRPAFDEIVAVSGLLLAIFGLWLFAAGVLYVALFGWNEPASTSAFIDQVFTTERGWALIVIGSAIGVVFAVIVLAVSVVSMPMLVDCDVSASKAVQASIEATRDNPGEMLRWGVIVAALLVAGSIPLFIGLAVVLPWLGYSTWHLYTRLVDRDKLPGRRRK